MDNSQTEEEKKELTNIIKELIFTDEPTFTKGEDKADAKMEKLEYLYRLQEIYYRKGFLHGVESEKNGASETDPLTNKTQ